MEELIKVSDWFTLADVAEGLQLQDAGKPKEYKDVIYKGICAEIKNQLIIACVGVYIPNDENKGCSIYKSIVDTRFGIKHNYVETVKDYNKALNRADELIQDFKQDFDGIYVANKCGHCIFKE